MIHEEDLPIIRQAIEKYDGDQKVLGLVLKVLHFKGDYWSIDPWMYRKATRVIRNGRDICSTTDCCDFHHVGKSQMIKSGPYGRLIPARVFHYGWVKDSLVLRRKRQYQRSRFSEGKLTEEEIDLRSSIEASYPTYSILKDFTASPPPHVMCDRIGRASPLAAKKKSVVKS